jgi:hypothetical protein
MSKCKQHTRPCERCPFRRDSLPGYIGGAHPDYFQRMAMSEVRMPCHLHLADGVDYSAAQVPGTREHSAPQCAGRAVYWRNVVKVPRDRTLITLAADHSAVFSSPREFLAHHRERALELWRTLHGEGATMRTISERIAERVTDLAVYERYQADGSDHPEYSIADARADLEAEVFSELTGLPIDYHTDWRESLSADESTAEDRTEPPGSEVSK